MQLESQDNIIKIIYKDKIIFVLRNVKQWYFKKELLEHNYLLEFKDFEGNYFFECRIGNKKKINEHLLKGYLNLEDIFI